MRGLVWYYLSRAVLAGAAAVIAWTATHKIGLALITGLLTLAIFVWYARSGHFIVDPSRPLTPLRRDEREQAITYRATSYAFIATMVLLGLIGLVHLPLNWAPVVIGVGILVYFASQAWLRRVV